MRTRRDIQTKVLVLQSLGLYSIVIQRQCPKTEVACSGKVLVQAVARYKIRRNEWGAVPKDLSGIDTGSLRASLVHVRVSK